MAAKNTVVSGLIHMDCTRLRNILISPSMRVLTGMHGMLHTAYTEHAKRVAAGLQDIIDKLRKRPSEFPDFALYMEAMGAHLSAAGTGRKKASEEVLTAKSLLFLLQPMLEKEEMMQLEAERQTAIREADGVVRAQHDGSSPVPTGSARGSLDGVGRGSPSPLASDHDDPGRPTLHRTESQRRRISLVSTERELLNVCALSHSTSPATPRNVSHSYD
jgi:hypothetical protein